MLIIIQRHESLYNSHQIKKPSEPQAAEKALKFVDKPLGRYFKLPAFALHGKVKIVRRQIF